MAVLSLIVFVNSVPNITPTLHNNHHKRANELATEEEPEIELRLANWSQWDDRPDGLWATTLGSNTHT